MVLRASMDIGLRKGFVQFAWLALFVPACAHAPSTQPSKDQLYLDMARGVYNDGHYPQCLSLIEQSLQINPKSAEAVNLKGLCMMGVERYDEAEKFLLQSCEKLKSSECWNQASELYYRMNNAKKCEEMARKALEDPAYTSPQNAWIHLALAHLLQKQYGLAQKAAEQARRLAPQDCAIRVVLSKILIRKGNLESAVVQTREATTLCPAIPDAHFWYAYALYSLGKKKEAHKIYSYIVAQFKTGDVVEQSKVNLDLLENRIPIPEPKQ